MYSPDTSGFTISSGSRLLSESPLLPSSSSYTGPGGLDLSLSELSLTEPGPSKPFNLIAAVNPQQHQRQQDEDDNPFEDNDKEHEGEITIQDAEKDKKLSVKLREEKLQHDLFILKKMNASFSLYNDALRNVESANDKVTAQLEHTDALLNKYVAILSKSEEFSRLIFDERWQGAEEDEENLERERVDAEKKAQKEAEERAQAIQREKEREEREEQERLVREERERMEHERKGKSVTRGSGVRGVRGTRASMRAMASRGTSRGASVVATAQTRSSTTTSSGTVRGTGSFSRGTSRRS